MLHKISIVNNEFLLDDQKKSNIEIIFKLIKKGNLIACILKDSNIIIIGTFENIISRIYDHINNFFEDVPKSANMILKEDTLIKFDKILNNK